METRRGLVTKRWTAGTRYDVIAEGLMRKATPAATIDLTSELKKAHNNT